MWRRRVVGQTGMSLWRYSPSLLLRRRTEAGRVTSFLIGLQICQKLERSGRRQVRCGYPVMPRPFVRARPLRVQNLLQMRLLRLIVCVVEHVVVAVVDEAGGCVAAVAVDAAVDVSVGVAGQPRTRVPVASSP